MYRQYAHSINENIIRNRNLCIENFRIFRQSFNRLHCIRKSGSIDIKDSLGEDEMQIIRQHILSIPSTSVGDVRFVSTSSDDETDIYQSAFSHTLSREDLNPKEKTTRLIQLYLRGKYNGCPDWFVV